MKHRGNGAAAKRARSLACRAARLKRNNQALQKALAEAAFGLIGLLRLRDRKSVV